MNNKSRIPVEAFLANLPLFRGLGRDAMHALAADVEQYDAPRGSTVFSQGDACSGIYFIVFGQIKLTRQADHGAEMVMELTGAGECLSAETLFLDRPYGATAQALVDTKLVHLARPGVLAQLERNAAFARKVIVKLSQRVEHFVGDLESYALRSARERVVGYLLGELNGHAGAREAALRLPASKGIIAARLHLTHEHFSRVLHELADTGLIAVNGRQIGIPDVDALRARATS